MTLHPPKDPEPGARPSYVWNGVTIYKQFARRPRVLRLEASKPSKGVSVAEFEK